MQASTASAAKRTATPHSARLDRCKSCFCKPASAAEIFFASHGGKLVQASPAPAAKRSAAPPGAARQVQKPLSQARFARKKSRRQALTFSFYKARPLRRQKYSSLRMAENSCRLHPLRRKNAPPPSLGAARQPQKPLSQARFTQKSQGGKRLDFLGKLIRICPNRGNP